jgi:predicted ATPase/DNA-binding SARP family transcriptional activator
MNHTLEIRLLGPFQVMLGGRPAEVSGSKRQGLLALLALRCGHTVDVDELIDAVWGEELPSAPRNAVQHHVARLRAVLGPDSIIASPDGYALRAASVDARRFEELLGEARIALREGNARAAADSVARALELWRGAPLHGLTDLAWFNAEARRLQALQVDALEERFETALACGEHREIVSALHTALEENPVRERLWGQLMLALYRSGRQADALQAFQEARGVLAEQTGLDPGPELRRLQAAILRQDPAIAPVPAERRRRGNLPTPTTSFIGRERELGEVVDLLREHRLVTLIGPPGVGKSRLALEALHAFESELRNGGWLVELARAGAAADVVRLVAQAIDAHGADPLARVIGRLCDGDATLLLDACEHALEEAARIASAVLAECPQVRVIATSREVLHIAGEVRFIVEPLPLPDPASSDESSPALRLFAARARAARGGFKLTGEAVPIAAEITRRVDGLPLAIELAAARVHVLGLAELLSMVERRLALLYDQPGSDPMRTALRGLVEWSYDLLHADEKKLLHHVAVHRGGACLASLIAVGSTHGLDETTVTYLLGALVDKSIVLVSFPTDEARYDLLDTVRDYALERLSHSGGLAAARRTHAEYFARLAEAARPALRGADWQAWTLRLTREHDNLWAALTTARDTPDPDVAIRLGASLGWYFSFSERVSEGRHFLELAMASASDDAPVGLWIELLASVCFLATEELDLDAAIEAGERALALGERDPEPPETAEARALLALPLAQSGEKERAAALARQAGDAAEAAGDHWVAAVASLTGAMGAAVVGDLTTIATLSAIAAQHSEAIEFLPTLLPATMLEAWVADQRGDSEVATDVYRRVFELSSQTRFADHAAFALARLGVVALENADERQAEDLFKRALAAADAARAPWVTAYASVQLGRVLAAAGDVDAAERLYQSALEWSERPRPHRARESLFLMLAGTPGTAALLGLAELADARGDTASAGRLRTRAELVLA